MKDFSQYAPKPGYVLALKGVNADMTAHNGFVWPESGEVVAPDFLPTQKCGNGLHFFLWGAGDSILLNTEDGAKYLVLEVDASTIIDLGGKAKSEKCNVIFCGPLPDAVEIIQHFSPENTLVMYGTATAGNSGTATAGNSGTATAGDYGTATAGDSGILIIEHDGARKVAAVDGINILPNVPYCLNDAGEFVRKI